MSARRLAEAARRLAGRRVVVVGDVMVDHYLFGSVERISPEAPVPVLEVVREHEVLGGAANVAANLASLGAEVALVGLVGRDAAGKRAQAMLRARGIDVAGLVADGERPTTLKTRVVAGQQQIVRVDRERRAPAGARALRRLEAALGAAAVRADAILVSDYNKGVVQPVLLDRVREIRARQGIVAVVDPKALPFEHYRELSAATPNLSEASHAVGRKLVGEAEVERAGKDLREAHRLEYLLVTRGAQGMSLFSDRGVVHIPAVAREVFDVSGAGDTVAAVLTLGLAAGIDAERAARLANAAAAVVVARLGTAVVDLPSLLAQISERRR